MIRNERVLVRVLLDAGAKQQTHLGRLHTECRWSSMCCSRSHASSAMKTALSAQAVIRRLFRRETTKHKITPCALEITPSVSTLRLSTDVCPIHIVFQCSVEKGNLKRFSSKDRKMKCVLQHERDSKLVVR